LLPPPALPEPIFWPGEFASPFAGALSSVADGNPEGAGEIAPVAPALGLFVVDRSFVPSVLIPLLAGVGLFVGTIELGSELLALESFVWAIAVPAMAVAAATARMMVFIVSSNGVSGDGQPLAGGLVQTVRP
jgi:hypothetical protein